MRRKVRGEHTGISLPKVRRDKEAMFSELVHYPRFPHPGRLHDCTHFRVQCQAFTLHVVVRDVLPEQLVTPTPTWLSRRADGG